MGLLVLVLSSALLPSWEILVVLLLLVAAVTTLLWRSLIRIYSKAQLALEETFAQPPLPRPPEISAPLAGLLKEAQIETLMISADSLAKGRLIRELGLRERTGASIVAIERNGGTIVNPSPDETLQEADQVLLLGSREQLESARRELLDRK